MYILRQCIAGEKQYFVLCMDILTKIIVDMILNLKTLCNSLLFLTKYIKKTDFTMYWEVKSSPTYLEGFLKFKIKGNGQIAGFNC